MLSSFAQIATRNGAAHITPILLIFPILLKGEETVAESGIEFADTLELTNCQMQHVD